MSKRIWQHPEIPAEEAAVASWRSVGELEKTDAFQQQLEREFPEGSGHLSEEDREVSRRNFMKLMGASSALGGLALVSCRRPEAYIVPYKKAPEWVIPGKPLFYASTQPRAEGAVPLVVTTFEGRPTKLEPNREHPDGAGTDALTQASVLDLYDPNRSQHFLHRGKKSSREEFSKALATLAKAPKKIGFVFGDDDCPTRNRLAKELATAYPGAKFYSYEALRGAGKKAANDAAFGAPGAEVTVDFSKASRILSLDCDFLATDQHGNTVDFATKRQGGGADYHHEIDDHKMNRLYMVESAYSLTGGMADHRLRVTPSRVFRVGVEIARKLAKETGNEALRTATSDVSILSQDEKGALFGGDASKFDQWTGECAADLKKAADAKGALVLAGSLHHEGLHSLVIAMNEALGAYGSTLTAVKTGREHGSIEQFVADVNSGTVDTVFLLGPSNPVYDTPTDLKFSDALKKAGTSVHLGTRTDATGWACTWHVPAAHYLESWSDARTASGVYSLVQPMILPLYGGVSEIELLSQLISWQSFDWAKVDSGEVPAPVLLSGEGPEGAASPAHDEVRKTFATIGGEGDDAWKNALKSGFVAGSKYEAAAAPAAPDKTRISAAVVAAAPSEKSLEVSFVPDASVWDGRYIDNGWLQEAPDPISKLSWDNAAYVSPKTAKALGVYQREAELAHKGAHKPETDEGQNAKAPFATIKLGGGRDLTIPVLVAFGHADNCITIPVGYGQGATDDREGAVKLDESKPTVGLVGRDTGFNANVLRTAKESFIAVGASADPTGKKYKVALVQEHNAMHGRALAREISTNEVHGKGDFEDQLKNVAKQGPVDSHAPANQTLYQRKGSKTWEDDKDKQVDLISDKIHQWGMTVDLNTCIGCSACLVACQAENNIPIVGKEQVAMGREMHWIRMDRYYATPAYERDDHGHIVKDGDEKKKLPSWVTDNPEMISQPVACAQCENAPCETVCPVNATIHTEEGLNTMAYNRCIGTRYCANNCPYKARRFNYFDYNNRNPLIEHNLYKGPFGETKRGDAPHLQRNPNVSVRMRGVMEKCTYCVQRLESAKIKQKQIGRGKTLADGGNSTTVAVSHEDLRIKTDSVRTACQDACPTKAISFGNLLNEKSQVVHAKHSKRSYDLISYVGALPRTSFLARVKNPNQAMPDAQYRGLATINTA